jgi:TolA-binding protein
VISRVAGGAARVCEQEFRESDDVVIAAGWWAQHWSEVAAVVLVASFIGLVGQAVRSSLFLGQTAVSRRAKKRSDAAAGTSAAPEELRLSVSRLERRIAQLEQRLSQVRVDADERPLLESLQSLEQRIESLAAEGLPPAEIALIVEEPTGRVELILNLRRTASRA